MSDKMWVEFVAATSTQWQEAIRQELKGADYDLQMKWLSPEGITIEPFYLEDKNERDPIPVSVDQVGKIGEYIKVADTSSANSKALEALQGGVQVILFDLDKKDHSGPEIEQLLEGIFLDMVAVYFLQPADPQMLEKELLKRQANNCYVVHSHLPEHITDQSTFLSNMQVVHYSGDNMVEELAEGISQAHSFLIALMEKGLPPQIAAVKIAFLLSCGKRYLFEIAKIRALRWLWTSLCAQYGADIHDVCIIAESSVKNFTSENTESNMVRNTAQVMSAVLGGASIVYAHPHAELSSNPGFGERMARNIQHLLVQESYMEYGVNASQGSWFLDAITRQLAEKAWDRFRVES